MVTKNFFGDNIDEIEYLLLNETTKYGVKVSPRGYETKELIGISFCLENQRNRITYNMKRRFNIFFALGEFIWYISGSNKLEKIESYNKRYKNYSDDGETLYGAYGKRIFLKKRRLY